MYSVLKDAWTGDYTAQDYYDDLSRAQKLNLKHALIYGYQGTTNYGYNADTERIATQIVIWNICDGWFNNFAESTAVGIFTEGMSSSMATNVKACYNKIKEQMLSHTTIPSYAVGKKDTPTKQKMTTNSDGTFTITLTDSKNVSKYYDWQTAIKKYSYLSIITDTEGKLVIKSTKPIPSGSAITLTAKRNCSKYQNNIVDVAPMYMISGSGSQSSATYVQDYDPSEAKIAIYSDSLGTAQIKKYGSIITTTRVQKLITATFILHSCFDKINDTFDYIVCDDGITLNHNAYIHILLCSAADWDMPMLTDYINNVIIPNKMDVNLCFFPVTVNKFVAINKQLIKSGFNAYMLEPSDNWMATNANNNNVYSNILKAYIVN